VGGTVVLRPMRAGGLCVSAGVLCVSAVLKRRGEARRREEALQLHRETLAYLRGTGGATADKDGAAAPKGRSDDLGAAPPPTGAGMLARLSSAPGGATQLGGARSVPRQVRTPARPAPPRPARPWEERVVCGTVPNGPRGARFFFRQIADVQCNIGVALWELGDHAGVARVPSLPSALTVGQSPNCSIRACPVTSHLLRLRSPSREDTSRVASARALSSEGRGVSD
jgi:hypothetical protein